ncbi:hypothetical protein B7991_12790 [Fibrobacter sp. UWB3]|nr:hypothetical protein B7991_12790 [Fibrobacter sp. UWB3]
MLKNSFDKVLAIPQKTNNKECIKKKLLRRYLRTFSKINTWRENQKAQKNPYVGLILTAQQHSA